MEVIKSIEEVFNIKNGNHWSSMDGFKITTDEQEIFVLISNDQSCCESWGYLSSFDSPEEYIGAGLINISIVDEKYEKKLISEYEPLEYLDEGGVVFVNFETTNGTFQLAVYNAHNGYYGHSVSIMSNQLNIETGV